MPVRRALLLLPLLAAACAGPSPAVSPSARFAESLEQTDEIAERMFDRMDGFERRVQREQAAIGFALNAPVTATPGAGAAAAAGEVLAPAIAALAAHAERLHAAATGERAVIEPGAEQLDNEAAAGLERLRLAGIVIPDSTRQAGIAGIAALANGPDSRGRRDDPAALATAFEPQVRAVTGLLRQVIGFDAGTGTRGALRARRATLDATEARFLETVRRDRALGVAQRYALVRDLAEAREGDPLEGSFDAMLAVLNAAEATHTAIAAGGGAAQALALEGAVPRLGAYGAAPGRE